MAGENPHALAKYVPVTGGVDTFVDPLMVHFTHHRISSRFRTGVKIDDVILETLKSGDQIVAAFPPMELVELTDGSLYSISNRRLFMFRVLANRKVLKKARAVVYHPGACRILRERFEPRLGRFASKLERSFSTLCNGMYVKVSSQFAAEHYSPRLYHSSTSSNKIFLDEKIEAELVSNNDKADKSTRHGAPFDENGGRPRGLTALELAWKVNSVDKSSTHEIASDEDRQKSPGSTESEMASSMNKEDNSIVLAGGHRRIVNIRGSKSRDNFWQDGTLHHGTQRDSDQFFPEMRNDGRMNSLNEGATCNSGSLLYSSHRRKGELAAVDRLKHLAIPKDPRDPHPKPSQRTSRDRPAVVIRHPCGVRVYINDPKLASQCIRSLILGCEEQLVRPIPHLQNRTRPHHDTEFCQFTTASRSDELDQTEDP